MKYILAALFMPCCLLAAAQPLQTRFEKTAGSETSTWAEIIGFYKQLDKASPKLVLREMGMSDAGLPLHLALYSNDGKFDPATWHRQNKAVIFINNGIHPGEPDGIDASMLLLRDLVTGSMKIPDNVALAFIPVYNIGGCLNRSKDYRVDQNGPEAFAFRGNSQNLDLNRDFIKCDSKEARAFSAIFHFLDPDVFIDNHVSDGADYQHIMTLICSQHDKLGGAMGAFMNKQFEPALYTLMKAKGYDMVPYVNSFDETPDNGWPEFFEGPRYSSGYASLWNTFGFIPETHMLKTYLQRVNATYALMESFISFAHDNVSAIRALRREARQALLEQSAFALRWKLDTSRYTEINFKGFEAGKKPSAVSGLPRLYYDRSKPFEKKVKFYNFYTGSLGRQKPKAYLIPQGWWKVIDLLTINKVEMKRLRSDTAIEVEVYHIESYTSSPRQYEMHHLNTDVKLSTSKQTLAFRKGDYYIPMNQAANRFLMEVLEPESNDSYFAWNFFDAVLAQKEDYSDYMFDETAANYLSTHPELKSRLGQRRATDSAFAKNAAAQLDFVYNNSPFLEPDYLRYPVYRLLQ